MSLHCLLVFDFLDKKSSMIHIIGFLYLIFFSGCFIYFLFILYSQQFVSNVPSWGFLSLYSAQSLLRFLDLSVTFLHQIWEIFSLCAFKYVFLPHTLFSFWDLNYMSSRLFADVPQVTQALAFNSFCIYFFQISVVLSSDSPIFGFPQSVFYVH